MNDPDRFLKDAFSKIEAPDSTVEHTLEMVRLASRVKQADEAPVDGLDAGEPILIESVSEVASAAGRRAATGRPRRRRTLPKALAAIAACLLAGALGFGVFRVYNEAVAIVSLDINPSIELSVNRGGKVLDARGVNPDGEQMLSTVSVVGMDFPDAISLLLDNESITALVEEDPTGNAIDFTVTSLNGENVDALQDEVTAACEQRSVRYSCTMASSAEYDSATELGLTVGRYRAYVELQRIGVDIAPEQLNTMSMREIRDMIAENGGDVTVMSQGQGSGMGYGMGMGAGNGSGMGRMGRMGDS